MVRIRLRRQGLKKQPSYRIVVTDQRKARDGRYLEAIGFYNPRTQPATMIVQEDRALYWLSVGAQPSDAVHHILEKQGTLDRLARLHKGESMETLVAEAEAEAAARGAVSAKTTHVPEPGQSKKAKARATAEQAAAANAAETVEEAAAEVAEPDEAEEEA